MFTRTPGWSVFVVSSCAIASCAGTPEDDEAELAEATRALNGPACSGTAVEIAECISAFCRPHWCDGQLRRDAQGVPYQYAPSWADTQALFAAAETETRVSSRLLKALAYGPR